MRPPTRGDIPLWLILLASLSLSALVGWLDYHATEVQGTVLVLIGVTGLLTFIAPGRAWIIALILGLSVEGAYLVARALGIPPTLPMTPWFGGFLALIPASIGAAAGVGARLMFRSAVPH